MWKCIFSTETNRGVGFNREAQEVEYLKEIHPSLCGWFNVTPERYLWNGSGLTEVSSEFLAAERLPQEKAIMWEKIKEERDRRKDGGFKVNGWWFHSDQPSRLQHLGLVIAGETLPAIQWKTMSGVFVTLTPEIVLQIFQSGFSLDTALFTIAEQHRVAMESSQDPTTYNYKVGWPENFLGI